MSENLFKDIDCLHLHVTNLAAGLAFYRAKLGLKLLWQTATACGLGTENGSTEIVLSTQDFTTIDLKVDNVADALDQFLSAGGKLLDGPFEIDIGQCAVVADPWDNEYCLLDMSKGTYDTDSNGMVNGVSQK